jgi:C-terminal processing protease CtpA/Prc
MKGVFSWWFKPFVKSIKNLRDYYNTPIGGIYNDIKGSENPMNVPHRYNGNVYLLINYYTGSTALGLATFFKDYSIGKIIGEETRSEVNEFGDVYPFDLPNSKLWVWCSTKRYIRPSGEMTVGGLKPDIYYKDQNDSIINYTINMIKNE